MQKTWTVQDRKVELDYNELTSAHSVRLDGVEVLAAKGTLFPALMNDLEFDDFVLTVRTNGISYHYDLFHEGRSVDTGKALVRSLPTPGWAWVFYLLIGVIPILTLGGAIPAGLAAGAIMMCSVFARDGKTPPPVRVLKCGAVAGACWLLFLTALRQLS